MTEKLISRDMAKRYLQFDLKVILCIPSIAFLYRIIDPLIQ